MSQSASISYITKLLENPQHIADADKAQIEELLKSYPYFIPAHYLQAALKHKTQPFAKDILEQKDIYTANWLLFHEFLNKAVAKPEQVPETNTTTTKEAIPVKEEKEDILIQPVYTEDYFRHQGVEVSETIPEEIDQAKKTQTIEDEEAEKAKSLMVMMSFSEWLLHFKTSKEKAKEEEADKKALKTMWQKEKLAAALEEENEEIPENVFEMAVNSITKEDDLASESLADIYTKQGKYDKAVDMYKKLSLRNPQKKAYFARKIEDILKEKQ